MLPPARYLQHVPTTFNAFQATWLGCTLMDSIIQKPMQIGYPTNRKDCIPVATTSLLRWVPNFPDPVQKPTQYRAVRNSAGQQEDKTNPS